MNVKKALLIIFAIFALFLIGCSTKTQETPTAVQNLQKFAFATIEHPNAPAPSFKLKDSKGNTFTDNDLKGKVYIIQGFAPGCSSCAQEIATLNNVYNKYHNKGLEIISLDISSEDLSGAIETKERFNGGDWHWTIDTDNVAVKLAMKTLESTYIIDKEGIMRYKDESLSKSDILSQEIDKLI